MIFSRSRLSKMPIYRSTHEEPAAPPKVRSTGIALSLPREGLSKDASLFSVKNKEQQQQQQQQESCSVRKFLA